MARRWRAVAAITALLLFAGACGDVGDTTAPSESNDDSATTSVAALEPVQGGEIELLVSNEVATLDPGKNSPTAGATGQRDFALYGALVTQNPETGEMEPLLAKSISSNATSDVWTLTLRPGLVFSDGTPFNADAVKVNWERLQNQAFGSPSFAFAAQVASMTVVDDVTLQATLKAPNALFDRVVGRFALNYIASAAAIRSGHDLASKPIGAGPFLLEEWIRDDHITFVRNPNWFDAPRPYVDRMTMRVVADEGQRLDSLVTSDAVGLFTIAANTIADGQKQDMTFTTGASRTANGSVFAFNMRKPPFNDLRMRQALAMAIDWQAMVESAEGEYAQAATNLTPEGASWYTEDAALPSYDVTEAQALVDEYLAETGQDSVRIRVVSSNLPRATALSKFIQTSLDQMDGIETVIEPLDQPSLIQRMFAADFELGTWGYPVVNPDPDMYQGVYTGSRTNVSGYDNPTVNALFDEARKTTDGEKRDELYKELFAILAKDLPFRPNSHVESGWVHKAEFHPEIYFDGILRSDVAWVEQ